MRMHNEIATDFVAIIHIQVIQEIISLVDKCIDGQVTWSTIYTMPATIITKSNVQGLT